MRPRLRRISPVAPILEAVEGDIDPDQLFSGLGTAQELSLRLTHMKEAETNGGSHDHHLQHGDLDVNRHDRRIAAISVIRDRPLEWPVVRTWLQSIASLRGNDLLRVKGIINVVGTDSPVIVHGVRHIFDPPRRLDHWPNADRRTRIMLIARDFDDAELNASFDAAIGV